jgi:hypothetical protein
MKSFGEPIDGRVIRDEMAIDTDKLRIRSDCARRPAPGVMRRAIVLACLAAATAAPATAAPAATDTTCRPPPGGARGPADLIGRLDRLMKLGARRGAACAKSGVALPRANSAPTPSTAATAPPAPDGADPSVRRGLPLEAPHLSLRRGANLFARDENLEVLARGHPEWDPIGIREGAFVVLPSLRVEGAYSDNVFATAANQKSDAYAAIEPRLKVESDWNQNSLSLDARGIIERYASYPNLDSNQYSVLADGVLNVHHDLILTADVVQARTLIPRLSDQYAQLSVTQLLYEQTSATLQAVQTFNYVKLTETGSFGKVDYENGLTPGGMILSQSFQNRTSYAGSLRADAALSADVAVFIQEAVGHSVLNSRLRNHDETETLIGPNFQVAHLVTAELGVGYLTSNYADPLAKSVGNFTGRGQISYFPTELLTVKLSARQVVIDSGLISTPAYVSRQAVLEADYELLRNLVIVGTLASFWNKYQVISRHDFDASATLAAKYKISHGMALDLSLSRQHRVSRGAEAGPGFNESVAAIGVTVQR